MYFALKCCNFLTKDFSLLNDSHFTTATHKHELKRAQNSPSLTMGSENQPQMKSLKTECLSPEPSSTRRRLDVLDKSGTGDGQSIEDAETDPGPLKLRFTIKRPHSSMVEELQSTIKHLRRISIFYGKLGLGTQKIKEGTITNMDLAKTIYRLVRCWEVEVLIGVSTCNLYPRVRMLLCHNQCLNLC
jgi:hypothetical protein